MKHMNKQIVIPEIDGFYGAYYPNKKSSDKAMILMLGDSSDDRLAASGATCILNLCGEGQKLSAMAVMYVILGYRSRSKPLLVMDTERVMNKFTFYFWQAG